MKVITFYNNKGGVGKTTSAINISGILAALHGKKVLYVDLDGQGNGPGNFGFESKEQNNAYDVLFNSVDINDAIVPTQAPGIDILMGTAELDNLDTSKTVKFGSESTLEKCLSTLSNDYDYVIIDCLADYGWLAKNALTACDTCVIPMELDLYSNDGFGKVGSIIAEVKAVYNPKIVTYVLLTKFDKNDKLQKDWLKAYEEDEYFPIAGVIKYSKMAKNGQYSNVPLAYSSKKIPFVKQYREATKKIM